MTLDPRVTVIPGALYAGNVEFALGELDDEAAFLDYEGVKQLAYVLGDENSIEAPQVWILKLPPGFEINRHFHTVHRIDVVIKGSYTVGGTPRQVGGVTLFPAGITYGPTIIGESGCTLIEIFSGSEIDPTWEGYLTDEQKQKMAALNLKPIAS